MLKAQTMKMPTMLRALLVACLLLPAAILAAPDVRVVGLFSDRAVVVIDGRQQVLRAGAPAQDGVRLISADSESAELEIGGERITARLDGRVTARKSPPPAKREIQVWRNPRGMYTTVGSINGLTVDFLVDTGASKVAMNTGMARRLGIDYRLVGEPASVTTASGVENAWLVTLDTVKLGDLLVRNVGGVVVDGDYPEITLLGMSYLNRFEISNDGQLMTLRMKY